MNLQNDVEDVDFEEVGTTEESEKKEKKGWSTKKKVLVALGAVTAVAAGVYVGKKLLQKKQNMNRIDSKFGSLGQPGQAPTFNTAGSRLDPRNDDKSCCDSNSGAFSKYYCLSEYKYGNPPMDLATGQRQAQVPKEIPKKIVDLIESFQSDASKTNGRTPVGTGIPVLGEVPRKIVGTLLSGKLTEKEMKRANELFSKNGEVSFIKPKGFGVTVSTEQDGVMTITAFDGYPGKRNKNYLVDVQATNLMKGKYFPGSSLCIPGDLEKEIFIEKK
jgi:hypothetical protein